MATQKRFWRGEKSCEGFLYECGKGEKWTVSFRVCSDDECGGGNMGGQEDYGAELPIILSAAINRG